MGKIFEGIFKATAYPLEMLVFKTKFHYENKKEQGRKIKGSAIVASNHTSVYDFAQIMQTFFSRHLCCLMADVLFLRKPKILGWFLKLFKPIIIHREGKNFSFINESVEHLNKGGVIEIYPESRIPESYEEKPLEFKPSMAYIAMLSNAPIIPVYTDGNYFNGKRANVMIGKKIYVNDLIDENLSETENIQRITEYVRNRIIELKDETERRKSKKSKKEKEAQNAVNQKLSV